MDRPFVESLHIENYGCIRDATFALTPLHALIGPNDSGKSTVLRALRTLAHWKRNESPDQTSHRLFGAIHASQGKLNTVIQVDASLLRLRATFPGNGAWSADVLTVDGEKTVVSWRPQRGDPALWSSADMRERQLVSALDGAALLRLDPDALRLPNALIKQGQPLGFLDERGTGLAAIYDAIMVRDLPAFIQITEGLSKLFPTVKAISLINPTSSTKAMGVKLVDGTFVPTELMSEGLLYYLAFAAIPHLDPTAILLIEEPENGLHPARIVEVMRVLREISKTTQVLIATHSPLVVNELKGDEVTVVTRTPEHGTKGVLLKDTPNFEERSKVYALGELWVSYADGQQEAALLQGGPRS